MAVTGGSYNAFLDVLHEFKHVHGNCRPSDILMVTRRVKELFGGRPDLIREFNYFLPRKHKIKYMQLLEAAKSCDEYRFGKMGAEGETEDGSNGSND